MKIVTWNINGFRAAWDKGLRDFVHREQPDVLMLQEIKAFPEQILPLVAEFVEHYEIVCSSAQKPGYSGVSTWIRKPWRVNRCLQGLGEARFDQEGRYLVTCLEDIDIYNIYFPSGTSGEERQTFKYEFLEHLLQHLKNLPKSQRSRLLIGGDFNICHRAIDIHHPDEATKRQLTGFLPEERAWMDRFVSLGFSDCLRQALGDQPKQYSWWSYRANSRAKNLGWRIDYLFLEDSLKNRLKSAALMPEIHGSDHCPMVGTI